MILLENVYLNFDYKHCQYSGRTPHLAGGETGGGNFVPRIMWMSDGVDGLSDKVKSCFRVAFDGKKVYPSLLYN